MGFFDLHQANKRVSGHRRHADDGFEAPRNSLEFPVEASQDYHDDIPYSCQLKSPSPKMNTSPSEAPMKTLIHEELFDRSNNRRSSPSVVARLMGMDTFPTETKPVIQAKEYWDERVRNSIPRIEPTEVSSDHYTSIGSTPFKQAKQELLPYSLKPDYSEHARNLKSTKPQPREHPQEELLQKFKKEFEAWQSSRVWEHSRTVDLDSKVRQVKDNKTLAQENLNKEKLARYADSKRNSANDSDLRCYISTTKPEIATWQGSLQNESYNSKQQQLISKGDISSMNRVKGNDPSNLPVTKLDKSLERSFSSTRIVILKPSSEGSDDIDGSLVGSSKKLDKEGTMADFLEEVKERLKQEIQGKATIRGIETEVHFTERSPDPKQIARHIAKHIKESVTTDLRTSLIRSESTRSYRSEIPLNGPDSPELISRDTRKLLAGRMKNVLKNEVKADVSLTVDSRSRNSLFAKEGMRLRPMYDFSEMGKRVNSMEDKKVVTDSKTKSFRRDKQRSGSFDIEPGSPRNLVRSFSAPVSGTAFGKLLLEDQHVSTGAHIRRKQEASEHASPAEVRKNRKDGFNLKDTVSSLRHNFGLKGKLFRKKIQAAHELTAIEFDPMKTTVTTPSVLVNFGTARENFTEVPPSPASVCSSSFDDFCRPGHPSPDSPLEAPFIEDHLSTQVSGELNSKFPEPNSLSEQVANDEPEVKIEEPYEDETLELGHPEAYARKILVTAGLYEDQVFAQAFSNLDAVTRPISKWVFEKVEEVYSRDGNADEDEGKPSKFCGDTGLSRKMLFDLMNEALPRVLRPPMVHSTFKELVLCPDTLPHGRQLLRDLMHHIRLYIDHQVDESQSLESKIAWDLKKTPWPTKSYEESDVIGREIECLILRDLIDDLVLDMLVASS